MAEPALNHRLVSGLQRILPGEFILISAEQLRPFECDGLSVYRQLPAVAVLPGNADEVREIIGLCQALQVPVVARGAGTGLSAGALPDAGGLLLVLTRLNRILALDPTSRTATVQPGVRNLAISEAAAQYGLFYAPDPSSQISCSIGGNIAENAGGVHCLKYGLTVHNVLQLKVLTMHGAELVIGGSGLDSAGFNFLSLLVGSEGMLGVVTEITVRLLPKPLCARAILAAFSTIEDAGRAVSSIIAAGITPAGLEMMDNLAIQAAEDYAGAGYPRDAAAILLLELDGGAETVAEQLGAVQALLHRSGASSICIARDEAERQRFWYGRKNAFPAAGRLAPDYYCMDGTVPRAALAQVLNHIGALSRTYGLRVANVFHAGDGNLHPLILYDANVPGQLAQVEEMGARILAKCIEVGGTITGEHGVGLEKIRQMPLQFSDAEIGQFAAVKAALDPGQLLNPGKNIPVLKNCQEYRALAKNIETGRPVPHAG
jgi:glycolate oxidase